MQLAEKQKEQMRRRKQAERRRRNSNDAAAKPTASAGKDSHDAGTPQGTPRVYNVSLKSHDVGTKAKRKSSAAAPAVAD